MSAELESFFSGLSSYLDLASRFEAQAARFAAPSFSIFKYFSTSEDDITKILRDLLDPRGDHAQGALYLQAFLAQLRLPFTVPEQELGRATIRTQVRTPFNRRPDLLIEVPGRLVLGLENKINAADQHEQVKDYVEFVQSRPQGHNNWAFVFLTLDGSPPSPRSISPEARKELEKEHRLLCLSYRKEIHDWLQSCIGPCRAESVRAFVTDMSAWVRTLSPGAQNGGLMAEDLAKDLTVKFLSGNPKYVAVALSVIDNADFIRAILIAAFADAIVEALRREFEPDDGWEVRNSISAALRAGKFGEKYTGIYLRRSLWPSDCCVAFHAEGAMASNFLYGVWGKGTCEGDLGPKLHASLEDVGRGKYDPPYCLVAGSARPRWHPSKRLERNARHHSYARTEIGLH